MSAGLTRALPSGTVTFLFTDVERSTQTVGEMGDESYAEVQEQHRKLLRDAFAAHNGVEVGTEGDAFFVAFAKAGDAVAAAVDGQQALAKGSELRVRMGIHTGEAVVRDDNYVGHDVHRAKRVCDAGHGGQILLSQTTADLIRRAGVIDLGPHRLKDLEEPQHLFQVTGDDLESDFPPLRSLESFTHNLPPQRTSFVGREREIAEIRDLLAAHRLVTLTGIGGCGKTRLALHVGADVLGDFADGVFFVDLAPLSEADTIAPTVARAVGITTSTDVGAGVVSLPAEELLLAHLAQRRCLLILDNCEHILDDAAEIADVILTSCSNVTLLATSREALALDGEQAWRIPSLSIPKDGDVQDSEAVTLFRDRAQAVSPEFAMTPQNAGAVAEICRRLDGIPLAIEFAASRVTHLPPQEIAQRLGDMFRLLIGGRRRAQRQQTLQAALDWSFDLLAEPERILLRRLAVFVGSFPIPAVEGICAGDGIDELSVVDLLGSLVAKSLLHTDGREAAARYRLIETVRLYASEKLQESGEANVLRSRHRDWYQSWLETRSTWFWDSDDDRVSGPILSHAAGRLGWEWRLLDRMSGVAPSAFLRRADAVSREEVAGDFANFRAALEWSEAEGRLDLMFRMASRLYYEWVGLGNLEEGHRWLTKTRPEDLDLTPEERVEGLWAASSLASLLPDTDALDLADRAVAASGREPSLPLLRALTARANQAAIRSQWTGDAALGDEARRGLDEIQEMVTDFSPTIRASVLLSQAIIELMLGDADAAGAALGEAVKLTPDDPALWGGLGIASHLLGRHGDARTAAERYLALLTSPHLEPPAGRVAPSPLYMGPTLAVSVPLAGAGDTMRARELLSAELSDPHRTTRPGGKEEAMVGLAVVCYLEGDPREASRLLGWVQARTLDVGRVLASPWGYPVFRHYIRLVRATLEPDEARKCRSEGRAMTEEQAIARVLGSVDT